jgi:FkbM family methyltransferase
MLSPDEVRWAYRILLDRDPENESVVHSATHLPGVAELRRQFMSSSEFLLKNPSSGFGNIEAIALLDAYGVPGRLKVNLSDHIGLRVLRGEYERNEVQFIKKNLRSGDTFLDIGGNIGFFTVLASYFVGDTGRVITFEALSENVAVLKQNLSENPFCSNVSLVQAIIADRAKPNARMAYHSLADGSGNSGGASIASDDASLPANSRTEELAQDTLDNLLDPSVSPAFIKIDIEGAEALAFNGATRILSRGRPIVMSEVHPSALQRVSGIGWHGYFDLMRSHGYSPWFFENGEITKRADHLDDERVYNVAFLPAP